MNISYREPDGEKVWDGGFYPIYRLTTSEVFRIVRKHPEYFKRTISENSSIYGKVRHFFIYHEEMVKCLEENLCTTNQILNRIIDHFIYSRVD